MCYNRYLALVKLLASCQSATRTCLDRVRLSHAQYDVLRQLSEDVTACTLSELARTIGKSQNDLTTVLDNLETRSLVVRYKDFSDRRYYYVSVTSSGREAYESVKSDYNAAIESILGRGKR
jgi:MarR family 2-MHQ and catechol resistance regulon transcriptional repressor